MTMMTTLHHWGSHLNCCVLATLKHAVRCHQCPQSGYPKLLMINMVLMMTVTTLNLFAGSRPEFLPGSFREIRDKGHVTMSNPTAAISESIAINRGAMYTTPSSGPGSLYDDDDNNKRSAPPHLRIFSLPSHERLPSFDHNPANPTHRDLPCSKPSERLCKETSLFKVGIPSWNGATSTQYEETHGTDHHQGAHSSQAHDSATSVQFIDFLGVGVA